MEIIQGMTNHGQRLLALCQTGTIIEFTKLKVGDGFITDQNLSELNDLVHVIDEIPIESTDILEENDKVSMVANGQVHQITEDFYFRELGLYAIDPETEKEVLYAYLNKGENAGLIPMISSQAAIQEAVSMVVTIANATNVVVNYKDEKGLINSGHNMFDIVMKDHILDDEEKRGLANFGEYVYKRKTDDHLGYPEFYKTCLKEYNNATEVTVLTDRNYYVTGSPIIREENLLNIDKPRNVSIGGFFENFGEPNYVHFEKNGFQYGDEIVLDIDTGVVSTSKDYDKYQQILHAVDVSSGKDYGICLFINKSNKLQLYMANSTGIANKKWNIGNAQVGQTTLAKNSHYIIKLVWEDDKIVLSCNDSKEITLTCARTTDNGKLPYNTFYIGASPFYANRAFTGKINLIKNNEALSKIIDSDFYKQETLYLADNGHLYCNNQELSDKIYQNTGMAWFYGIDTEKESVRIPRNDYYFMNGNTTNCGNMITAGLPNIYGQLGGVEPKYSELSGPFECCGINSTIGESNNNRDANITIFDASRCSNVYGNSNTVQTNAVKLIPYMVVGRISSFGVVGGAVILDKFITKENLKLEINKLATKEELSTKQNTGDYALKSEIPSLDNYYTQTQIDNKLTNIYIYKGEVNSIADLPNNALTGETYRVIEELAFYIKTDSNWLKTGGDINLNNYVTTDTLDSRLAEKVDPADTLQGYGIEDAYTKDEIDSRFANVYCAKGSVENYDSLPIQTEESDVELTIGDVYNVLDTGANYVWTESGWDKLSETLDLTSYTLKTDLPTVPTKVSELENDSGYLTAVPSGYITESELDAKGYLTSIPTEYVTETELNSKNYQTSEQVQAAINTALGDIETLLDEINGGV